MLEQDPLVDMWGEWVLIRSRRALKHRAADYEIDLAEIPCHSELLDWVFHISRKSQGFPWDEHAVRDLVRAFDAIFTHQGASIHKPIDGRASAANYIEWLKAHPDEAKRLHEMA